MRYHENRSSNVYISLIQCREYVVRRDEKTAYIQLPCYQGREASGVWDIKLQAQARENGLCLNELNVSPTKPAQTGGGFMGSPLQGTSEQVSVGCWINSDELQAVPQAKSIFPPVCPVCAVTRLKQRRRKEWLWVLYIFNWGFRGIGNTIQEKTKSRGKKPTYMATKLYSFSLALCILTDRHTSQVRNFRKKEQIHVRPFPLVSHEFHSRPLEHSAPSHCIHLAFYLHKLLQYKKKKVNLTYLRSRFNFMHNYYSHC